MKRVTSKDVAAAAGVSRTTVSLVLNQVAGVHISENTRQRVIAAAQLLGYVPDAAAKALAGRKAQIIGLVLTRNPHQIASDGYLTQVLDSLIKAFHPHGLRLLFDIVDPHHQKEAYLQLVRSKRIDGIILLGPQFTDEALQALLEVGFPTVLMGQVPDMEAYCVDVDNCAASRMAVTHLVSLGHRRIACITNAPILYTAAADRLKGYCQALEAAGVPYDESLVRYGDFTLRSGYLAGKDLVKSGVDFTAAFAASDEIALGFHAALREAGRKSPEDLALVGFDDLPMAYYLDPPLTSVHLPTARLAEEASSMLISLLQGHPPQNRKVILETHLVVRESCGAGQKVH